VTLGAILADMSFRRFVIAVTLLAAVLHAGVASAQADPEVALARSAHELSRELMSPYCPGRTLADCPSPDAGAVRDEIRAALRAGEPVASIRSRIESRFGAAVVGVPTTTLGWALPILMLAAGALVLVFVLRRALARPALHPRVSTDVAARLQRELRDVER
jgi:cytochrome c-type biogenesis protein CcmH/NrfF